MFKYIIELQDVLEGDLYDIDKDSELGDIQLYDLTEFAPACDYTQNVNDEQEIKKIVNHFNSLYPNIIKFNDNNQCYQLIWSKKYNKIIEDLVDKKINNLLNKLKSSKDNFSMEGKINLLQDINDISDMELDNKIYLNGDFLNLLSNSSIIEEKTYYITKFALYHY